jgi:hypothetical protein
VIAATITWSGCFTDQAERPDIEACVASGLFEECCAGVAARAAAGVEGLRDTNHSTLATALNTLKNCRAQPGCEERLRSIATALAFYLEHDLDYATELGFSPSVYAAHMCCGVFGRDEGGSELKFTPKNVEHLLTKWRLLIQGQGHMSSFTPTADTIMVLELVISDVNKPLLIDNKDFLPYLVDALLLVSTSTLDVQQYELPALGWYLPA